MQCLDVNQIERYGCLRRGRDIRNNREISSTGGVGGIGGFCRRLEEDPLPAVLGVGLAWLVTLVIVTVRDRIGR
jgi:hypothetical protein